MLAGVIAALGAGLLWGLVFVVPLMLGDYPGIVLAIGRYIAFGVLAIGLAWVDINGLKRLSRADWIEATKLALVGNLLYYTTLASAIRNFIDATTFKSLSNRCSRLNPLQSPRFSTSWL